ncbi:MAG: hypothetical protein AB1427_04365 [Thermodesulfobacteriota bacterium]
MPNITLPLLITGAVVAAGYFILRFLINFYRKPVLEISLSPIDSPKWSDGRKVADLADAFLRKGFEPAGHYESREIPSLVLSGFVRPSEQIAAVIYDHPAGGIWVDVYVQYADGGSLTASNAPTGHELAHMPQQAKIYSRESSVEELLEKILSERKQSGRITISKEAFASNFEAQYHKEMKWRIDRGGPTAVEVTRVADAMGKPLDSAKLQDAMPKIQDIWLREKNRPRKMKRAPSGALLPGEFQQPAAFRQRMEQKPLPVPRLNVPALPVYVALVSALAYWCYYGYRYNQAHFPVSFTALIVFFSVFLVLFVTLMSFRDYHRRVRMCPMLKRVADSRPGAFLVITAASASLFYARERWIGKLDFREGGKYKNASTRLVATTKPSPGSLEIRRKGLLGRVFGWSARDSIPLPESDFSRRFTVSGTDAGFARKLLTPAVSAAIVRLEAFGRPLVEIDRNSVGIEIERDLSRPGREAALRQFLETAETVIEAAAQPTLKRDIL